MTLYKQDLQQLKYLIPLYVKGTLSDSEREMLEEAFHKYPELKLEVEEWNKINNTYEEIRTVLPETSDLIYSKIVARIVKPRKVSLFEKFMPSKRLSFALIAAQLLVITSLGFYIMNSEKEYTTLSVTTEGEDKLEKLNVVFDENASEGAIRKLLLRINGKIVDGPSNSGLYIIEMTDKNDAEDVLITLKRERIVILAEKAY